MKNFPILSIGFRPFFLLASLMAILNPTFWVSLLTGHSDISPFGSPLFWHAHEMIFGFSSALIAGFLLTASANWTGTKPTSGWPLLVLIFCWLVERASFFLPLNNFSFLLLSNIFFPTLIVLLAKKLSKSPKQLYVFIPLLSAISLLNFFHSYGFINNEGPLEQVGLNSAISMIRFLVFLMAGRVLPFFTRMKLSLSEFSVSPKITMLALTPLLLLSVPYLKENQMIFGILLFFAIVFNSYRNHLMFHRGALQVPMLLVLHAGLIFMILGLIIELFSIIYPSINQNRESIHATMAGGLGVIGIGIMSRVSLGHTGRVIHADNWICLAFLSVGFGALIRVVMPLFFINFYEVSLHYASGFWTFGFLIFFFKNFKKMMAPRPDGK